MTSRRCHLCGTSYEDDPYFREQPAHSPEKCLGILQYRYLETERAFREVEKQLNRATLEYTKGSHTPNSPDR